MKKSRLDFLKKHIYKYEVDILAGTINGSKGHLHKSSGYYRCRIGYESFAVHEVVAFAGKLNILDVTVDHIDRDKSNNNIHNLRPASRKLQANNREMPKRRNIEKIQAIRADWDTGKYTQTILAVKYGMSVPTIQRYLRLTR